MSNDPFAFIGSNVNYQEQRLHNTDNNHQRNYPHNDYNHPSALANQQKQYPSANPVNSFHGEQSHPTALSQSAPTQRRHAVATFGPGGMLITSFPFLADRYEIINGKSVPRTLNLSKVIISKVKVKIQVGDLFNGPLISSFTRKKSSVLTLLAKKEINDSKRDQDLGFLWKLLTFLVENDGVLLDEKNESNNWSAIKKIIDYIPVVNSNSTALETIQALLIQGNTLGACDYAQATNLWSHAIIIASFVDSETYRNTLNAFLEYEFTPGIKYQGIEVQEHEQLIPLQVIYNLFWNVLQILNSGQKWDWKVVLSIILANPTENILTAICSLGDELGRMNLMAAAHFCYLLCFTHSAVNDLDLSRLVLVSSDHINRPSFFKNYEAIQMTELLEYAKSLNGSAIPHFQAYKFAFAMEIADLGMTDLAAEYFLSIQSILSDYKGMLLEKYKVLFEVVDEVCDRQSIHFNHNASNGRKHAGWFTKGLDSLVSAAVGETLNNPDTRKKSRKYSISTMSRSEFGSFDNISRVSSVPLPESPGMDQNLLLSAKSDNLSSPPFIYDDNQRFNDSYYAHQPDGHQLPDTLSAPTFNQNLVQKNGHQQVNQRVNQAISFENNTAGDSGNGNVAHSNFGYGNSPTIPKNAPQAVKSRQISSMSTKNNVGNSMYKENTSMYYENPSQYSKHNVSSPPLVTPNVTGSSYGVKPQDFDSSLVNVPSKSLPDKIDNPSIKNSSQSIPKPESPPERSPGKDKTASNQNAPASKSLVSSLWASFPLFGKSSKDNSTADTPGPIKAKLGQELNCYFDEATGKWVFPDAPQTEESTTLPPPPQTKAPPPTQNNSAATSRQPSPAPSGAASPAPVSSTPKATYIGALGGSTRSNRRTARSKYVDVLNPTAQGDNIQPSFDMTPVNNFGSTEPKIMKPMFTPNTKSSSYDRANDSSYLQNQVSDSASQIPKGAQESLNVNQSRPAMPHQVRPGSRSPQNSGRPNPGMNRQNKPVDIPFNSNRPLNVNGHFNPQNHTNSLRPQEHDSNHQNQVSDSTSQIPKGSQESLNWNHSRPTMPPQVRPGSRSPQNSGRPNLPNSQSSGRPGNSNRNLQNGYRSPAPVGLQNGYRAPAPTRPVRTNRPTQPGNVPLSSARPGINPGGNPPTNGRPYIRPSAQSVKNSSSTFAGNRMASGPAVARTYRPQNPSSSRVPDDI